MSTNRREAIASGRDGDEARLPGNRARGVDQPEDLRLGDAIENAPAIAPDRNQLRVPEYGQLLRHVGLALAQGDFKLAHAALALAQHLEQGDPGRMGQQAKELRRSLSWGNWHPQIIFQKMNIVPGHVASLCAGKWVARCVPGARSRWHAQLEAYQRMPEAELLAWRRVTFSVDLRAIISRNGVRVTCEHCGEEIINGRERTVNGGPLRISCAGSEYFQYVAGLP